MYNDQGLSDAYKEVLHESSHNVGSTIISPDYAFRLENNIKFLVEAKKPHVNLLRANPNPAHQLRAYACNFKLPISILTNFEEFAVYDCHSIPKKTDNADTARICYLRYTEFKIDLNCYVFSSTTLQGFEELIPEFVFANRNAIGGQHTLHGTYPWFRAS
jgi:hypothetical protein